MMLKHIGISGDVTCAAVELEDHSLCSCEARSCEVVTCSVFQTVNVRCLNAFGRKVVHFLIWTVVRFGVCAVVKLCTCCNCVCVVCFPAYCPPGAPVSVFESRAEESTGGRKKTESSHVRLSTNSRRVLTLSDQ